ncbi:hypothetical protein EDD18DRAFT_1162269 [Armillaria luteobubalina]|uniref:Uncharacterized protein n=1 Tax=Armillaria luteobubalina TaxID=153913 RepID=A0AA39Q714_9AGAR|nr:hypothetical protein EDD18DRAFT_1162269 [Armillaria luteobubalina]
MPFQWFTQLFHTIRRLIMPQDNPEMCVFSKTTDVTSASSLLRSLKENYPFLKGGFGNIIVTKIEYCKCRHTNGSPWEHEFLFVTLEEAVGAKRTAFLMAERLMDDAEEYVGAKDAQLADIARRQNEETNGTEGTNSNPSSPSSTRSSTSTSRLPRVLRTPNFKGPSSSSIHSSATVVKDLTKGDPPDAVDRLVIFPNREAFERETQKYPFDVIMVMDLTRSQSEKLTLERFAHLLQTTSRNTPQYHVIFSQCYWYAYTIWRILELAMYPRIDRKAGAERQCTYAKTLVVGKGKSVDPARSPETIKTQWEAGRLDEDREWDEKKKALTKDAEVLEARVRELEREVESLRRSARSTNAL